MASNLVLTPQEGNGSTLTLYGNRTNAGASGAVWTAFSVARESPWQKISYTGYSGIDAMFMGGRPRSYRVRGFIFATTAIEATLTTLRNNVLALNAVKERYTASGPFANATSEGMVVTDVRFEFGGEGSGQEHVFEFDIVDLGV